MTQLDQSAPTNSTLDLIAARTSTRAYAATPLTPAEKSAILNAAFRAPTGGNMMLYSIIEVTDQALKDRLAVTCDDQSFIAKAPWVLVFLADFQKWIDIFAASDVGTVEVAEARMTPGPGDLLLACSDALIAAQNAVVAAESLGIGSCYIGDILELGETHAEMFDLPAHVLPIAMLCLGRPLKAREPVVRFSKHVVHENAYRRLTPDELAEQIAEMGAEYAPHGMPEGLANYGQAIYRRKFASAFMTEMNRSAAWWLKRWQRAEK
ncbi:MAG: nitroreductase family protein [Coriobacteriia bacterium]|nr:nitroreductase family protein [Coriobacteriia bacterium]